MMVVAILCTRLSRICLLVPCPPFYPFLILMPHLLDQEWGGPPMVTMTSVEQVSHSLELYL